MKNINELTYSPQHVSLFERRDFEITLRVSTLSDSISSRKQLHRELSFSSNLHVKYDYKRSNTCNLVFSGGNGLARCRSWREGRESQRWSGSGSGGNGGNGSRDSDSDSSRSERRAERGQWNLLEEESRYSTRSSSSPFCSR